MMPLFAFALPGVAFFTSAGGMAAVTSTMAALGLADAGTRATRRTQRTGFFGMYMACTAMYMMCIGAGMCAAVYLATCRASRLLTSRC